MWLNVPMWGMCSTDPDYSSSSNWTTNALDVIMNPASSLRVAGYSALGYSGSTQVNAPSLIVEHGNEEWNGGNDNKSWAISAGFARYGLPFLPTSSGNEIDICALRAVCGARDAKATGASYLSRVKFVLGMWATFGLATTGGMDGAGNKAKVFGGRLGFSSQTGDYYTNDVGGSWGRPIDNVDGICFAGYID